MADIDTHYLRFLTENRKWTHYKEGAFQRFKHKYNGWHHFDINIISECFTQPLKIIFCNHYLTNFSDVIKNDTNPTSIHLFDVVTSRFLEIKECDHLSLDTFKKNLDDQFTKADLKGVVFTFEPRLDEYRIIFTED